MKSLCVALNLHPGPKITTCVVKLSRVSLYRREVIKSPRMSLIHRVSHKKSSRTSLNKILNFDWQKIFSLESGDPQILLANPCNSQNSGPGCQVNCGGRGAARGLQRTESTHIHTHVSITTHIRTANLLESSPPPP